MKKNPITHLVCVGIITAYLTACSSMPTPKTPSSHSYNVDLAASLGADDYGMKSYVMVTLLTGPMDAQIIDKNERAALFQGHFSNMTTLAEQKKLALSGPFIDASPMRGLYIFNVATIDEAKALVETDPAVKAGIFTAEFAKYYGSAALMQVNDTHNKIQKLKVE